MPIIVRLDDVLHQRRVTLTELSERIGITLANLSILKTGKARAVRFSTLDSICQALRCQPGDILEFVPAIKTDDVPAVKTDDLPLRGNVASA
jgi:putative transcriptional regulator